MVDELSRLNVPPSNWKVAVAYESAVMGPVIVPPSSKTKPPPCTSVLPVCNSD